MHTTCWRSGIDGIEDTDLLLTRGPAGHGEGRWGCMFRRKPSVCISKSVGTGTWLQDFAIMNDTC